MVESDSVSNDSHLILLASISKLTAAFQFKMFRLLLTLLIVLALINKASSTSEHVEAVFPKV
jgi:hypothetical protein